MSVSLMRFSWVAAISTILMLGCSRASSPTGEATPSMAPNGSPSVDATSGRSEYDPSSPLLVKERDRFRACVHALDSSVNLGDAVISVQHALDSASTDPRWVVEFDTPLVDASCPLPPAALDKSKNPVDRIICHQQASPYLVFVFVGDAALFEERFPEDLVRATEGMRRTAEQSISTETGRCYADVSQAWYLTSDDLQDSELLERYIFFRAQAR